MLYENKESGKITAKDQLHMKQPDCSRDLAAGENLMNLGVIKLQGIH